MSIFLALVAAGAAAACTPTPLTLDEAKALVLAAPNVIASARDLGAHPAVEVEDTAPKGWSLRAYATDPCRPANGACSSLIGYYEVASDTAEVYTTAGDGDERLVTGHTLAALQSRLRKDHCL